MPCLAKAIRLSFFNNMPSKRIAIPIFAFSILQLVITSVFLCQTSTRSEVRWVWPPLKFLIVFLFSGSLNVLFYLSLSLSSPRSPTLSPQLFSLSPTFSLLLNFLLLWLYSRFPAIFLCNPQFSSGSYNVQ